MTSDLSMTTQELQNLESLVETIEQVPLEYGKKQMETRFSPAEYSQRRQKLISAMSDLNLEVLLLSSPESQCWLHGYQSRWYRTGSTTQWPPTNFSAVHKSGELVLFDTPDHQYIVGASVFLGEGTFIKVTFQPIESAGGDPNLDVVHSYVVDWLANKGWLDASKIGYELWSPRLNAATTAHLANMLKSNHNVELQDVSTTLRLLQLVKSEEELNQIKTAGKILDAGYDHLLSENLRWSDSGKVKMSKLDANMTEIQIWAEMEWAMAQQGGETAGLHNTVSRTRNFCHALSTTRQVGEGPLLLDPSGVLFRYHANTARQLYFGTPSKEFIKASLIAAGALDVLNSVAKAGLPFSVVDQALREYYESANIWEFRDWIGGYQIGIAFTPDWVGEFTWNVDAEGDNAETDKIIEAGMVTNFESFVGGTGFIDTVVFKETGVEVISKLPQVLYLVDEGRYIDRGDL